MREVRARDQARTPASHPMTDDHLSNASHPRSTDDESTAAREPRSRPRFNWQLGLLLPSVTLVVLAFILTGELDMKIASWIYAAGGDAWIYKNGFWTETVIHKLGRNLTYLGVLSLLALVALSYVSPRIGPKRRPLAWLIVAIVLSTGIVSIVKRYSGLDCPWSIWGLGGSNPYITLFDLRPMTSGCFPSGHASGGYAWLALYFFFLEACPRYRWKGLAVGLCVGLLFGIGQQLRGAHFLSHDVITALVCWTVPAMLFIIRGKSWAYRQGSVGRLSYAGAVPPLR